MITRAMLFDSFVGRDAELRFLLDAATKSGKETAGSVVLIVGEAGVGKSRLLREFEAASRSQRGVFIRVRCEELATAYEPLLRALETLRTRRELRRVDHVERAISLMTSSESDGLAGADRKREIVGAVAAAFMHGSRSAGQLTLVIDDIHWCDLASLAVLAAIARVAEASPILVAAAYRQDEVVGDFARASAISEIERGGAHRIALSPLTFGDLGTLLKQLVPLAPDQLVRHIFELSEGRPFVAEEIARSAVERGFEGEPEIALSLRTAVLERVSQLADRDREIVAHAAVLGRNFAYDDLIALGFPFPDIVSAMSAAHRLQLLEERSAGGVSSLRFRHALTREILYRELLAVERSRLHLKTANHLADKPDRIVELAYHLTHAGDKPGSVVANEAAGEHAAGLGAFADAAYHFRRAFDDAADPQVLGRVSGELMSSLYRAGDLEQVSAVVIPMTERLVGSGLTRAAFEALLSASEALDLTRPEEARALFERAREVLPMPHDDALRSMAERAELRVLIAERRYEECLEVIARAKASPRAHGVHLQFLLLKASDSLAQLRRGEESLRTFQEGLAVEPSPGEVAESMTIARAKMAFRVGETREALKYLLMDAAECTSDGHLFNASASRCDAARVATDLGDFALATELLDRVRSDGFETSSALPTARARMARALGGKTDVLYEEFDKAVSRGVYFAAYGIARDLAFMVEDRSRSARILMRALEIIPASDLDGDMIEGVLTFGADAEVAHALERLTTIAFDDSNIWDRVTRGLVRARLALREHRRIESIEHAKSVIEDAARLENWVFLYTAQELAGDLDGARKTLSAIGATAELARLDRRHGAISAEPIVTVTLTRRESQVARAVASGASTKDVGAQLAIGTRTVETHLANAYAKLGITTRHELAAWIASQKTT